VYSHLTKQPVDKDWYVNANTGMMGVVPAWRLGEMFQFPDVISLMEREKADWIQRHQEDAAGAEKDHG
jgi:hypothetical protein